MTETMLLVAGLGLFLAGIVKGATGLGYASCALPFLATTIGLKPAMAVVIIPAMATNVRVAFTAGHFVETIRRFASLYAAMIPGIALGVLATVTISPALAAKTLGAIVVAYAVMTLAKPHFALPQAYVGALQIPTGFANGVLTGLTGSQVMPLFPYMMSINLDPGRLVQAINLAVMIASVFLAVGLYAAGIFTPEILAYSVVAIVPALAGVEIGNRLRLLIPADQFKTVILGVLMLTGLLLLVRGG